MANTYTQIHIHAVFAVQSRLSLIQKQWQEELYQYITGIISPNGHKLLQIGGMPDHVHVFFGMRPTQSLSDLMQDIKHSSSLWINQKRLAAGKFSWQEGYGAFSYGKSQIDTVVKYIQQQEQHHKKRNFAEEYLVLLQSFDVAYDEKYVLKFSTNIMSLTGQGNIPNFNANKTLHTLTLSEGHHAKRQCHRAFVSFGHCWNRHDWAM